MSSGGYEKQTPTTASFTTPCFCFFYKGIGGFSDGSADKESACNARDTGDTKSIPGPRESPRVGKSNPFQYSCLENRMDKGAWWATTQRVAESQTTKG